MKYIFQEHQDLNVVKIWAEVNVPPEHQDLNVVMFLVKVKYILRTPISGCCHVFG